MNYNDSKLKTMTFCKRKQIMCEYANVIGRCIYTQCMKRPNDREMYYAKTNFERWGGGDTE